MLKYGLLILNFGKNGSKKGRDFKVMLIFLKVNLNLVSFLFLKKLQKFHE